MDEEFLRNLHANRNREVFARLISLDFNENPIEKIEGRVTGGSISIDGASAVRRTCSVSLVAKDININDFYWGLKNKFTLEIGLTNTADNQYPEIIWFPQGMYVITSFNTSQSTNNYSISIQGKDKMCLLNGDIGGSIPASVDFGVEEFYDKETETTTYIDNPIKRIIRESLHNYANEPYHNIIIEDLEEAGLELLEYRGDDPIYLVYDEKDSGTIQNGYVNGNKTCTAIIDGVEQEKTLSTLPKYLPLVDLISYDDATTIKFKDSQNPDREYQVAKVEYGQTAGYHITELTYPGDLISSIGESLTSILDKIKNMLGEFEYFYDIDGRFIFRKKKTYINSLFNNIKNTDDEKYVENFAYNDKIVYTFEDGDLVTSYQNNPNLMNLKNDYSIWGSRKGVSGAELPIHYRYAIDKKPLLYINLGFTEDEKLPSDLINSGVEKREYKDVRIYCSEQINVENYLPKAWKDRIEKEEEKEEADRIEYIQIQDWREIIYQMALDYYQYGRLEDFLTKVINANKVINEDGELISLYPTGKTGYEQYYTDIQGFWRDLYYPSAEDSYFVYTDTTKSINKPTFELDKEKYSKGLYVKEKYRKFNPQTDKEVKPEDILVLCKKDQGEKKAYTVELRSWYDTIGITPLKGDETGLKAIFYQPDEKKEDGTPIETDKIGTQRNEDLKYVITHENGYKAITQEIVNRLSKQELFIQKKETPEKEAVTLKIFDYYKENTINTDNWYIKEELEDYIELEGNEYLDMLDIGDLIWIYHYAEDKDENNSNIWKENIYRNYILCSEIMKIDGSVEQVNRKTYIDYNYRENEYFQFEEELSESNKNYLYWNKQILESPETLNFWFDFLDTDGELEQFSIPVIGDRTKVVNDKDVKSIYFRQVPEIIYIRDNEEDFKLIDLADYWHYTKMKNIPENYFSISAQGKSAQDVVEEFLYNYSYCIESINISAVPIYHLEPNMRILVRDDSSKIDGEYLVSRISIPLTYNGTMSITATKAPTRLF